MKENKDPQRKIRTCLDGSPCAEMMQKIMGEQGIGSLCEEMMRSLTNPCHESKEGPQEVNKEESHGIKE